VLTVVLLFILQTALDTKWKINITMQQARAFETISKDVFIIKPHLSYRVSCFGEPKSHDLFHLTILTTIQYIEWQRCLVSFRIFYVENEPYVIQMI
jgi:hypothetical protein